MYFSTLERMRLWWCLHSCVQTITQKILISMHVLLVTCICAPMHMLMQLCNEKMHVRAKMYTRTPSHKHIIFGTACSPWTSSVSGSSEKKQLTMCVNVKIMHIISIVAATNHYLNGVLSVKQQMVCREVAWEQQLAMRDGTHVLRLRWHWIPQPGNTHVSKSPHNAGWTRCSTY